jgi:hypothetical protein
VYYFLANKFAKTAKNLPHYLKDFILLELLAFHEFFEITILTEFSNDIETIFRAEYIFEFYDIGMVKPLQ